MLLLSAIQGMFGHNRWRAFFGLCLIGIVFSVSNCVFVPTLKRQLHIVCQKRQATKKRLGPSAPFYKQLWGHFSACVSSESFSACQIEYLCQFSCLCYEMHDPYTIRLHYYTKYLYISIWNSLLSKFCLEQQISIFVGFLQECNTHFFQQYQENIILAYCIILVSTYVKAR